MNKTSNFYLTNLFAYLFLGIIVTAVIMGKVSPRFLAIYLVLSFMTYLFYAKDKSASQTSKWRTPELTLHLLSLAGGWPGAIIAQNKLRHKTKKVSFRIFFLFTVVINFILFLHFTPAGKVLLQKIIENINMYIG